MNKAEKYQLINIKKMNPQILLDIKYATADNFVSKPVYSLAQAYLREKVAQKLDKVQKVLEGYNLGLKIWDAYRPLSVQHTLWSIVPDERYVADPAKGSNHNRGAAVDVTLIDAQGNELSMPTGFDDFTVKAHLDYTDLDEEKIRNREFLSAVMIEQGFTPLATEWWHFNDVYAQQYPLLDIPFELLEHE